MNASILGMYNYYIIGKRNANGIIVTEDGQVLGNEEAKRYIKWCKENGYEDLHSCPKYSEVKNKLTNKK